MPIADDRVESLAERVLAALDAPSSMAPLTDEIEGFDVDDAYRVATAVIARRMARGERPVGWKIGFTNRTIWDEYGVHAPIWGLVYDTTVVGAANGAAPLRCDLGRLMDPRIEPEIVLRLADVPDPGMDEAELLACVDAVALGFEIVHSVFPDWRFRAADTVAALALHGGLWHGPWVEIEGTADGKDWLHMLASFEVILMRDGIEIDRGAAANVLDGPISAFGHLVRGVASDPLGRDLRAGDLVTTGSVTRVFPIAPGERWSTEIAGLPLPGLTIDFD